MRAVWSCAFMMLAWLVIPACGDDANVTEASCSCSTTSCTEATCKAAGDAAGCETSAVEGSDGCAFKRCARPPECTASAGPLDAGRDSAVDPSCASAPTGLFSSTPPCADVSEVTVNGAKQLACKCTQACPCNFECGSIALAAGGVISSVCAPPKIVSAFALAKP